MSCILCIILATSALCLVGSGIRKIRAPWVNSERMSLCGTVESLTGNDRVVTTGSYTGDSCDSSQALNACSVGPMVQVGAGDLLVCGSSESECGARVRS